MGRAGFPGVLRSSTLLPGTYDRRGVFKGYLRSGNPLIRGPGPWSYRPETRVLDALDLV